MIPELKIGQPIQFDDGMGTRYAAQVTMVWSSETVNLVYFDPHGAAWREANSVPRLMWQPGNGQSWARGFCTLDQEGITK